jgi:replicative DNA helicase
MTNIDLHNRLLQHEGIPMKVLEQPWLIKGSIWENVYTEAIEKMRAWDMEIMFQPSAASDMIVKQAWDSEAEFVIVDHVHRFAWGNERRRLEEELMKLTNLALEFNIPVLILAQLRRFVRGHGMETYPRPLLQDFRETEAIGNEAARAMAVWRQRDATGAKYVDSGSSEIIILKDRFGPLGGPLVWFDGPRQLFVPTMPGVEDPEGDQVQSPEWDIEGMSIQ